ncbi:MAG: hypothetical protein AABW41_04830 [Nanoarchaeota archaeon]
MGNVQILDIETAMNLEEECKKEKEKRLEYDDLLNVLMKYPEFNRLIKDRMDIMNGLE